MVGLYRKNYIIKKKKTKIMGTFFDIETIFENIASAINNKGVSGSMTPSEMPAKIQSISGGGITPTGNINITTTNTTDVTNYATAKVVDANLIPNNIKRNVQILGITGTYGGDVPSEYVEVLYLQGNGSTTRIDTGIKAKSGLRILIEGISQSTEDHDVLIAGGIGYGNSYIQFSHSGTERTLGVYYYNTTTGTSFATSRGTSFTMDLNDNIYTAGNGNGDIYTYSFTKATFSTNYNLNLFCHNRSNSYNEFSKNQLKIVKIWDNGTLVRDFIPVKFVNESSAYEGAMYDKVSGTLFRNAGTGTFLFGPELNTFRTGTGVPPANLGIDGDVYLDIS